MSKQAMEAIIGRAVTDGAFRNALFADLTWRWQVMI